MSWRRQCASFVRNSVFDHPSTITAGRYSRFTVLSTFIRELLLDRSHTVGTARWTSASQAPVNRNRPRLRSISGELRHGGVGFVTNPRIDRRRCRLIPTSARNRRRHGIGARNNPPRGGHRSAGPSAPECRRWRINLIVKAPRALGFVVCLPRRMLRCLRTGRSCVSDRFP